MKSNITAFLLLLLVGISGWRVCAEANRNACINTLRQLEGATDQAAIEMNMRTGDPVAKTMLDEYIRGGMDALQCPSGGRYTFGTVGIEPRCSIHGTASDPNARGKQAGTQELWGREPNGAEDVVDQLLVRMSREQAEFDTRFLKEADAEQLRSLADRLFPRMAGRESGRSRAEVEKLVAQLGADSFKEREEATQHLAEITTPFRAGISEAARGRDPEMRRRARAVMAAWGKREEAWLDIDFAQYEEGLKKLLEDLDEASLRAVLVRQAELARAAEPINEGQKRLIDLCLAGGTAGKPGDR